VLADLCLARRLDPVPCLLALACAANIGSAATLILFIVGSIANIIVVQAAERCGIHIDWRRHARVGVPVTLGTLAVAAVSLWLQIGAA
jgi:Na+/H+ antiporter NhaD/arsenite permease-like protein